MWPASQPSASPRAMALAGAASVALLAMVAPAIADAPAELVAAAKQEGQLTTIALPHDWCGYGETDRGLQGQVRPCRQRAQSRCRIRATRSRRSRPTRAIPGPQAPDVIDVGLSFGPSAKAEGLIQPYKVATWDTIPDSAKDAEGYWYGDYYGVLAFEVNKDIVTNAAAGLGRPAGRRLPERGRPRGRSARLEPGDPGRVRRRAGERRRSGRSSGRGRPQILLRAQPRATSSR